MQHYYFICIILFSYLINQTNNCGTQQLKDLPDLPPKVEPTDESRRILESTQWHPIRFYFDYSLLPTDLSPKNRQYLLNIFKIVEQFFTSFLQVKTISNYQIDFSELMRSSSGKCYNAQIPSEHQANHLYGYDYAVYVTVEQNLNAEYIAWSALCLVDATATGLNRPVASQINLAYFNEEWLTSGKYDKLISTIIHELTHSIVFDKQLWQRFVGKTLEEVMVAGEWRDNGTRIILNTTKVREFSQEHFACNSFPGGELENQGVESSRWTHWERRVYGNEIMTASYYENCVYSKITMGLMEDSGWYQVDYTKAEQFSFAKNAGCFFLGYKEPVGFDNYICYSKNSNDKSCYFDYTKIAKCYNDEFNDGIYGFISSTNGDCRLFYNQRVKNLYPTVYEQNSRCFMSNVIRSDKSAFISDRVPTCLEAKVQFFYGFLSIILIQCQGGVIYITFGSDSIGCPEAGGIISVQTTNYNGTIECPVASTFCDLAFSSQNCQNLCSGHGTCISNGQCSCYSGYTGADCSSEFCKNNCADTDGSSHGICNQNTGRCDCYSGWGGEICNIPIIEFFCDRCNKTQDCLGDECVCTSLIGRYCDSSILSWSIYIYCSYLLLIIFQQII